MTGTVNAPIVQRMSRYARYQTKPTSVILAGASTSQRRQRITSVYGHV